jgi:hypothetical protein
MKPIVPTSFQWLLQTLKEDINLLETVWFNGGFTELWSRLDMGKLVFEKPTERKTVLEAVDMLAAKALVRTFALCHIGPDLLLRPLSGLRAFLARKQLTDKLDFVQVLPSGYQHKRLHRISLICEQGLYQSIYSLLLNTGEVKPGMDERCYRKLKSEAARLVHGIEKSSELRVEQVKITFLLHDGCIYVQNIEECMLVPGQLLGCSNERMVKGRKPVSLRLPYKVHREAKSQMASPLRIRTPALTCPNSPSRRTSGEVHFPILPSSPRQLRGFSPNFKELLVMTMAKKRLASLRQSPRPFPLASIEEIRRDDDCFLEQVGIKRPAIKATVSEMCLSSASTNESAEIHQTIIPKQPSLFPRSYM